MTRILGIVNLTRDSFSDGGRYLAPGAALAHARGLLADGADVIDLGAESTHPDAEHITPAEEWLRLEPVLRALVAAGAEVSVDTYRPETMDRALAAGAAWINDVTGLASPAAQEVVARHQARVIVMYSRSPTAHAARAVEPAECLLESIEAVLGRRLQELEAAGLPRARVVLDPGMGFFLGPRPAASLEVLAALPRLRALGCPLCLSTSRKSFLGALVGRPVAARGAATLASEAWCLLQDVDYLRTHDVAALADARTVLQAIRTARQEPT